MEKMKIGGSKFETVPLGVGTWAWGDEMFWRYGKSFDRGDVEGAFTASLDAGITFFDTAEIYGRGESERILGSLVRAAGRPILVASKYLPFPTRFRRKNVLLAAEASLERLGLDRIDLYQVHWPFSLLRLPALIDALADLVEEGMVGAIGISNYSATKMDRVRELLGERGIPLVSNQVEYSLLRRKPERNGVLQRCRETGVTLIAFSPLAQGLLTGKYHGGEAVDDFRRYRRLFFRSQRERSASVVEALREIAAAHHATPGQVSLRWLIQKGNVIPIAGAKTARQAGENAGALKISLSTEEMERLDEVSHPWR